jgi:hypothetical protein
MSLVRGVLQAPEQPEDEASRVRQVLTAPAGDPAPALRQAVERNPEEAAEALRQAKRWQVDPAFAVRTLGELRQTSRVQDVL